MGILWRGTRPTNPHFPVESDLTKVHIADGLQVVILASHPP